MVGVSEEAAMDIEQTSITGGKRYFIDTVNIKVPRKGMDVVPFLKDGMSKCITYIACCLCVIECCCIFMTCAYDMTKKMFAFLLINFQLPFTERRFIICHRSLLIAHAGDS